MRLFRKKRRNEEHGTGRAARTEPETEAGAAATRKLRDREQGAEPREAGGEPERQELDQAIRELRKRRGFKAADIADLHAESETSAEPDRSSGRVEDRKAEPPDRL